MTQKYLLILIVLIAGCDNPEIGFIHSPEHQTEVEGWQLSLYRQDNLIQVIRTNTVWGARRETMRAYADRAVLEYFGCKLNRHTIVGDQVAITAEISC